MKNDKRPAGLILSAGFSSRMKDFKPLMKIGQKNSLEMLIESFKNAGVDDVFVVVGYNAEIIGEFLADKNVHIINNENFEEGMFTSVKKGVEAVRDNGNDCVLMTPVDIPIIPPYIIKATLDRFCEDESKFVVSCYEGKKGHPLCFSTSYTDEILSSDGEKGMKSVTEKHADKMYLFETHCEGIVLDMDTQEAYKNLVNYYNENKYPDEAKCRKILKRMETPAHVIRHCDAVTNTAVAITEELNRHGCHFSVPLVRAAGLLHDVLRVRKKHWEEGSKLALEYGYPEVADIIMDHMNYMHPLPVFDITEKDIICLSDKLRQEDKLVTLDERLEPVRVRWKDNPDALEIIEKRIMCAEAVMTFIEEIIHKNVYDLVREADEAAAKENPQAAKKSRRLVLIRHGETQKHREKIFLGQKDVPLNAEGKEQCTHVGLELQHFEVDTDTIYCSDLKRAKDSAKIIARILGDNYNIEEVPEFREMDLGAWDGMYISEVREKFPEEYKRRGEEMLTFKIDDKAESFVELSQRVEKKLRELLKSTVGDVVIVSHSGVNRVIKCLVTGRELADIKKMKFARGTYEIIDLPEDMTKDNA